MAGKKGNKPKTGKVLPPEEIQNSTNISKTEVLAVFTELHERMDLVLDKIEEHDEGFIKRMNKILEEREESLHQSRFHFSKIQAYSTLVMKGVFGFFALYLLYLAVAVVSEFWIIIPTIIFFAVSQSGQSGFSELVKALAQWIRQIGRNNDK